MTTSDWISLCSLFIALIGVPLGYYLGCRSARHAAYNDMIDTLESITQTTFNLFLEIYTKQSVNDIKDYHLMIAYYKKIQRHCSELRTMKKIAMHNKIDNLLIEVKQIMTDKLFHANEAIKQNSLSELIVKMDELNALYTKRFY
ncbi:hypothetical protein GCM10023211_21690 [Orbus sasakiae]|uniref:Uncharacterized protein n=1 Tax=Orbus sasakiae TaxID=1078475 RepID=A0ABP9NAV3_9GAMM